MALSRRNILVALGAVVGGGGALVGTGAFTTVSAERSVEVSTAGDGNAFLTIEDNGSAYVAEGNGNQFQFDLGNPDDGESGENQNASGFNTDAITTLTDIATITNNAADGNSVQLGLTDSGPSDSPDVNSIDTPGEVTVSLSNADVIFHLDTIDNTDAVSLAAGEETTVDVVVDTTEGAGTGTDTTTGSMTIVAEDTSETA